MSFSVDAELQSKFASPACSSCWLLCGSLSKSVSLSGTANLPACAASWTESARHWGAFVGGDADGDVPGDVLALGDVLADPLGFADLVVLVDDPDGLLSGRTLAAA